MKNTLLVLLVILSLALLPAAVGAATFSSGPLVNCPACNGTADVSKIVSPLTVNGWGVSSGASGRLHLLPS